jgi:mRNA (guanine-N7-)-methyltransferase
MRNFNNFIKARLIATCTPRDAKVLDIACGKGGDLLKWKQANIRSLVGLDIADVSIEQANKRYHTGRFRFRASYNALDCFTVANADVA